MKRAKKRQFRLPTPMYFFPIRFALANLIRNDSVEYDGPLISGEIGMIDGFRIIETVLR
jgi:hypothetical protein